MMRPGTDTGSLQNHLYSRMTAGQPTPELGMGATVLAWTDRYAATVTAIDGAIITVRRDRVRLAGGSTLSECQTWAPVPDPEGARYTFRFDEKRGWREVRLNDNGRWVLIPCGGYGLRIGARLEYRDPSF
jgi:hypothetical protein